MATQTWRNKAGGNFATASNWKHHHAPATGDSAVLKRASGPITSSVDETLASLTVSSNVKSFVIDGGTFTSRGLSNSSTIDVTGGTADFGATASILTNNKLIEADGGAVNFSNTTVRQGVAGTIEANVTNVTLTSTTIDGGTLSTAGGGLIETGDSKSVLNGATVFGSVANTGTVQVNDGNNLTLDGKIANSGAISVDGATKFTGLLIGATAVTLSGAGQVSLVHDGYIAGIGATDTLTNVNDTISGAGFIRGPLTVNNGAAGVIDANGGILTLNNGDKINNSGLIEATGTGVMVVRGSSINSGGGGTVEAGAGARIQINAANFTGGTLTVDAGGELQTSTAASTIGAGVAVTNAGTIQVTNGAARTPSPTTSTTPARSR